jgi:tRNA (mo5U34)-methyltransferase
LIAVEVPVTSRDGTPLRLRSPVDIRQEIRSDHVREISSEAAQAFIDESTFLWHQRFELAPGVYTPGANDIGWLLKQTELPMDLSGMSVVDIGATNGAMAFECERRGAARVVAVDILGPEHFGFSKLAQLLESKVEYVDASVYELADVLKETFDVVIFWGVLYHLRHPLLGLDSLRRIAKPNAFVTLETAVCDHSDPNAGSLARFHRLDDLGADPTNWWSPTIQTLAEWCESAGFNVTKTVGVPAEAPQRAVMDLKATDGTPEYLRVSYERPLVVKAIV